MPHRTNTEKQPSIESTSVLVALWTSDKAMNILMSMPSIDACARVCGVVNAGDNCRG